MKQKLSYLLIVALAVIVAACSSETETAVNKSHLQSNTYLLQLDAEISDYGGGQTRAAYSWPDNTQLVLQFFVGAERIHGNATYHEQTGAWTVTTSRQITADTDGDCTAYYFVNASSASGQAVTLGVHSAIYQDTDGTFTMTEDNVMIVKLQLSPRTARVRFTGKPLAKFSVSGLAYHTSYSIAEDKFTSVGQKITDRFDKEGDTGYYYVAFGDEDERQLMVDGTGRGAFLRTFAEEVLASGQSGFIALPAVDQLLPGWKLINTDNQQEITLPAVSAVEASKLRSHFATVTASVTDLGNGTLSDVGFIYSSSSEPTPDQGTMVSCGKTTAIQSRLASLTASTTYYIRAYAVNERGTTLGSIAKFTTLSEEEDGTGFGREDYDSDEDLNGTSSSHGTIGKEGFGSDEDLNGTSSSHGTIGKEGFPDDEDLNGTSSSHGTIGKEGFSDDEELNGASSSGATISKEGYVDDENLRNGTASTGTINKEGFGKDENWN